MNKNLNRFFTNPVITAIELFSAGWCNLACKYCYIPKTNFLKTVHSDIIKKIEDGSFINTLKEAIGDNLESISHWGTEPTLTVKLFKKFYEDAMVEFPKLNSIKLSSNFMVSPDNLFQFITYILPQTKQLNVDIQVSCDGPPYITDKNRTGGSTEKIIENCITLTKMLNEVDDLKHKISMHVKPTFGDDDISLATDYEKIKDYYLFFDDFLQQWIESNRNNKVSISRCVDPTIVLPGNYCVNDGKNFYKLLLNQIELNKLKWNNIKPPESAYHSRWIDKLNFYKEYFTKQRMFSCSAGDSCLALGDVDGNLHMCHASFYLDHEEYLTEAVKSGLDIQTMEGIKSGRMFNIRDNYIFNLNNNLQTIKALYKTRAYNDFVSQKINSSIALTLELADAKQISPIYKNVRVAELLSYIVQTTECPFNCLLLSGSILTGTASVLRLFGNGFFEETLKIFFKRGN